MDARSRVSCRKFFKKLKILPFHSPCIFSLLLSVVGDKDYYKVNSVTHSINTRQNTNI